MTIKLKPHVKLRYDIYKEFDQGEYNETIASFKSKLKPHEVTANNIIFNYAETLFNDLDLTYQTFSLFPQTLISLYQAQSKKYIPAKNKELIIKSAASYITLLALNNHNVSFQCSLDALTTPWAQEYSIQVGNVDFLTILLNDNDSDEEVISLEKCLNAYHELTQVDLHQFIETDIIKMLS